MPVARLGFGVVPAGDVLPSLLHVIGQRHEPQMGKFLARVPLPLDLYRPHNQTVRPLDGRVIQGRAKLPDDDFV